MSKKRSPHLYLIGCSGFSLVYGKDCDPGSFRWTNAMTKLERAVRKCIGEYHADNNRWLVPSILKLVQRERNRVLMGNSLKFKCCYCNNEVRLIDAVTKLANFSHAAGTAAKLDHIADVGKMVPHGVPCNCSRWVPTTQQGSTATSLEIEETLDKP